MKKCEQILKNIARRLPELTLSKKNDYTVKNDPADIMNLLINYANQLERITGKLKINLQQKPDKNNDKTFITKCLSKTTTGKNFPNKFTLIQ